MGAEQLLGHGDMLFLPPGTGFPVRVHGSLVSDQEVHRVAEQLRLSGEPEYLNSILEVPAGNGFRVGNWMRAVAKKTHCMIRRWRLSRRHGAHRFRLFNDSSESVTTELRE